MKTIHKILFMVGLLCVTYAADAQYRRYYPPVGWRSYQPIHHDGTVKESKYDKNHRQTPTNLVLSLNYGISQPLGGLKDYTDKTSFRGWDIGLLYKINPKLQVGLSTGFYDYYERIPRKIYHESGTAISAVQTHTLQMVPIQPKVLYFFGEPEQAIKPYVGLGIGVTNVNYKNYWGKFGEKKNSFVFSASPTIGLRIPFSSTSPIGFNADVKYNFAAYNKMEINNIQSVEVNVGLSIDIR